MAERKVVSQKARHQSFLRWIYGNLTCFSQEHMQTFGYLWAMLPVVDELYDKDEDKVEAIKTYSTFFNTEPQIGTMVVGLTAGLEEARANGDAIDDETINGIRAGISLGLANGGNILGPLFYIVVWNVLMYFGMKVAYDRGYSLGGDAVEALVGPESSALRSSIMMVGAMVIGSVAATWINIQTSFVVQFGTDSSLVLQKTIDGIFPKALNWVFVWFCWWLMTKKKMNPTVVMLLLVVVALVGVLIGVFDPGLSY